MTDLTYVQPGRTIQYTPVGAVTAGTPIRLSDGRVGIPSNDIAAGVEGDVTVCGIFSGAATSSDTWNKGDTLIWDDSLSVIAVKSLAVDGSADIVLGSAVAAKANGETTASVHLNEGPSNQGLQVQTVVYEFDCATGEDAEAHVLIPAEQNPFGLLLLGGYGIVTEQFAGTEDQGIVTIQDEDGTAICTLTASDGGADATGDVIVGTADLFSATTGDAAKVVAAGKAIEGIVSQATTGSAAGKMKVYAIFMPLL